MKRKRKKNYSFGTPKILLSHIISLSLSLVLGLDVIFMHLYVIQRSNCDEVQTKMATLKLEPTVKS